jgi:hypothetical protein
MNGPLRCQQCNDVIGMYEPMIVLSGGQARKTSRATERNSATEVVGEFPVGECYHRACYALAYSQEPLHETRR